MCPTRHGVAMNPSMHFPLVLHATGLHEHPSLPTTQTACSMAALPAHVRREFAQHLDADVIDDLHASLGHDTAATIKALRDMSGQAQSGSAWAKPAAHSQALPGASQTPRTTPGKLGATGAKWVQRGDALVSRSADPAGAAAADSPVDAWCASGSLPPAVQLAVTLWPVPPADVQQVWSASHAQPSQCHDVLKEVYPDLFAEAQQRMLDALDAARALLAVEQEEAVGIYRTLAGGVYKAACKWHEAADALAAKPPAPAPAPSPGTRSKGRKGRRKGRLQHAAMSHSQPHQTPAPPQPALAKSRSLQSAQDHALQQLCRDPAVLQVLMIEAMAAQAGVTGMHLPGRPLLPDALPAPAPDTTPAQRTQRTAAAATAAGLSVDQRSSKRGLIPLHLDSRPRQQTQFDADGNPIVKGRRRRTKHPQHSSHRTQSADGQLDHEEAQEAFAQERAAGLALRHERQKLIARARRAGRAHGRFGGAVAGYFWEQAADLKDDVHSADRRASERLLRRMNPGLAPKRHSGRVALSEGCTVDLHGQYKRDALLLLQQDILPSALAQNIRRFSVIVGAGKHSRGGSHPLATAVEEALRHGQHAGQVKSFHRNAATYIVDML